jgi:Tfp pilus assembly major pilin PilA
MKKLLIGLLIALVVVVVIAVVAIGLFLDGAIKKGVETIGPQVTKVDVKLEGVSLSLLSGSGKINGLVLGNPSGYQTPHAISVGSASISLSRGSLLSDKIVVRSIRIEAPEITLESTLQGNNLNKILDNVAGEASGGAPDKSAPKNDKAGKRIQVDDFLMTGAKLNMSLVGMGGKSVPVVLPDIHFANLGTGPEGISAADLTHRMLQEVLASATKAAASHASEIGKGAADLSKEASKNATESVDKATKGVTDLFKKKKE